MDWNTTENMATVLHHSEQSLGSAQNDIPSIFKSIYVHKWLHCIEDDLTSVSTHGSHSGGGDVDTRVDEDVNDWYCRGYLQQGNYICGTLNTRNRHCSVRLRLLCDKDGDSMAWVVGSVCR